MSSSALLADLDPEQEAAVQATTGPVVIRAGAGSGKTRVITRRTAYAIETGVIEPRRALVVTFTERAAAEMASRIRALGYPGVTARTFHSAALAQLRVFWSLRYPGEPPGVLESKVPILARRIRRLPAPFKFTPALDVADQIEWAKRARMTPGTYLASGREGPLPVDVFLRLWEGYEADKAAEGLVDFDDMILRLLELYETTPDALDRIHRRFTWFCVDEYQDTNPLADALLDAWLGDRRDVCVVGDEDQTIYTFNGATDRYLREFAIRHPGAREIALTRNYRSAPDVLDLANRLLAGSGSPKRLRATQPSGPRPTIVGYPDEADELRALVGNVRHAISQGTEPSRIAVLVRMNAQTAPVEAALAGAGIDYVVRGGGVFGRREAKAAIALLRRLDPELRGDALREAFTTVLRSDLGYDPDGTGTGREAREVTATLGAVIDAVATAQETDPDAQAPALAEELGDRGRAALGDDADGVVLSTYHRAKGLEWNVVILPMLEEGSLPVRGAEDDPATLAEERRLLYVGITRARQRLHLSWAGSRRNRSTGRPASRKPSRFLADLADRPVPPAPRGTRAGGAGLSRATQKGPPPVRAAAKALSDRAAGERFERLRRWRAERARADGVSAYVVAHDSLLRALAERAPRSRSELRNVSGMGPTRIERYGDEILAALRGADHR